jgi:hypothetical protein
LLKLAAQFHRRFAVRLPVLAPQLRWLVQW